MEKRPCTKASTHITNFVLFKYWSKNNNSDKKKKVKPEHSHTILKCFVSAYYLWGVTERNTANHFYLGLPVYPLFLTEKRVICFSLMVTYFLFFQGRLFKRTWKTGHVEKLILASPTWSFSNTDLNKTTTMTKKNKTSKTWTLTYSLKMI